MRSIILLIINLLGPQNTPYKYNNNLKRLRNGREIFKNHEHDFIIKGFFTTINYSFLLFQFAEIFFIAF